MKTRRNFLKSSLLAGFLNPSHFDFSKPHHFDFESFLDDDPLLHKNKQLKILSEKPLNLETPPHLLNDNVTPSENMFVRNNGILPEKLSSENWELFFSGESVEKETTLSLESLQSQFKHYTYRITLECGGNGRSGFSPQASGNQWGEGAVSCAEWTGVRLKDVLNKIGVKSDAVYIGYYGADLHLSGDSSLSAISRGVPIHKAFEDETLLAWEMNGQPIPLLHGFPLRLVVGGYPASVSGKWLKKIVVRNRIHDGEKMNDYRVPKFPIEPGAKLEKDNPMEIIESMPVKSLITFPKSGAMIDSNKVLTINGHAWAGEKMVKQVFYSIDYGAKWHICELNAPINRYAWQQWRAEVSFPQKGYYEVWAKAIDEDGIAQSLLVPGWNPKGYLNNACHRIAIKVI